MQATGSNQPASIQQSIRVTADGLSFYHGTEVIVVCGPSTRISMTQFHREEAQLLLDYVCPPTGEPRTVLYNVLPELEIVEIFAVPTATLHELREQYPSHRILGVNSMVLERMWRHDRNMRGAGRRMYAYRHDKEMLLFTYSDTGLHWANTFAVNNDEEALFFLLSAWRQLELDAEKDECLLLQAESMAEQLKPFLRHIATLTPADVLGQERAAKDTPFDIMVI